MGIAVGLILAAFGAILTWAVNADVSGLNVTAVGVILMIVGLLVVLLDIFWWRSWTWYAAGPGRSRRTYVRETAAPVHPVQPVQPAQPAAGRRVVVDEEVGGPPAGPPPP
jgi:thiol:disulfide interchange protein